MPEPPPPDVLGLLEVPPDAPPVLTVPAQLLVLAGSGPLTPLVPPPAPPAPPSLDDCAPPPPPPAKYLVEPVGPGAP